MISFLECDSCGKAIAESPRESAGGYDGCFHPNGCPEPGAEGPAENGISRYDIAEDHDRVPCELCGWYYPEDDCPYVPVVETEADGKKSMGDVRICHICKHDAEQGRPAQVNKRGWVE